MGLVILYLMVDALSQSAYPAVALLAMMGCFSTFVAVSQYRLEVQTMDDQLVVCNGWRTTRFRRDEIAELQEDNLLTPRNRVVNIYLRKGKRHQIDVTIRSARQARRRGDEDLMALLAWLHRDRPPPQ